VVKATVLVVAVTASALLQVSCRNASSGGRYPTRPIEFIVAGGPGGGLDITARIVDDAGRREGLGPTFLIANRDGGGGNVARAAREAEIDRAYLFRLIKRYDIQVPRGQEE